MSSARAALAAAAVILFAQLILPPVIGVANNGDFSRTYGIFHLTMPVEQEVRYAATRYQFDAGVNYFGGYYSSEILLLPPALMLDAVFSKDGTFDVRFLGLVHGALFLAALWLFLPLLDDASRVTRWLVSGLAVAMFCDVMYVAYLNSFYTDVASYLFLLLTVVLALRVLRWNRPSDWVLLAAASLLLVTSKAQHSALGLWIALFFSVGGRRWFALAITAVALLWIVKSTPPEYAARGCFSTIFSTVLAHSRNVDRTLADLGLDSSYRPYIGMVAFSSGSPMGDPRFVEAFSRKVNYDSLATFFATHPRDAYVALRVSLDEAGRQRPALGNFDISAGLPPYAESHAFALWSNFKRALFDHRGSRYFTCFAATCVTLVGLLAWRRDRLPRGALNGGLTLIAMAYTELAISSLADAIEPARHHLLFYALFDILVLGTVWLIADATSLRSRPS